jgi:hypothetical protein
MNQAAATQRSAEPRIDAFQPPARLGFPVDHQLLPGGIAVKS